MHALPGCGTGVGSVTCAVGHERGGESREDLALANKADERTCHVSSPSSHALETSERLCPVGENDAHSTPAPQISSMSPQHDSATDNPAKFKRPSQCHSSQTVLLMLAGYIVLKERKGKPFAISGQPYQSPPLSIGKTNYFGLTLKWQGCSGMDASSMTQTPALDRPNHTRLTTNTSWVTGWKCRPGSGFYNAGWRMRCRRLWAH